jgi:hypothetical protein
MLAQQSRRRLAWAAELDSLRVRHLLPNLLFVLLSLLQCLGFSEGAPISTPA